MWLLPPFFADGPTYVEITSPAFARTGCTENPQWVWSRLGLGARIGLVVPCDTHISVFAAPQPKRSEFVKGHPQLVPVVRPVADGLGVAVARLDLDGQRLCVRAVCVCFQHAFLCAVSDAEAAREGLYIYCA
jgi:hypothetical protein